METTNLKNKQFLVKMFSIILIVLFYLSSCNFGSTDDAYWDYENSDSGSGVIITAYKGPASGIITLPETIYTRTVIGVKGGADGIGIFINTPGINGVVIPGSFTSVGNFSFYSTQLNRAEIGNSVISIGDFSFYNNQLTRLTIGNNVTAIGIFAFSGNHLSSVAIPDSVTSIGNGAFVGNPLTSIRIGANVNLPSQGESFSAGFDSYYGNNGRKAGLYTRPAGEGSTVWAYSPE